MSDNKWWQLSDFHYFCDSMLVYSITIISLFAVVYTYAIYPLLLKFLSSFKKSNLLFFNEKEDLPGVSIVMAAYNEEKVIEEKIVSLLNSNYPSDKMEILIGSDNSTDRTDAIIKKYAEKHTNIILYRFDSRTGKTAIINDLVSRTKNEILILTDANVMFERSTVFELIKNFKNSEIALVDSRMMTTGIKKEGISLQEKTYIQAEVYIKHYEGKIWGTMMGPFGGCYAMRKSFFHPVPSHFLVDDFFINMKTLIHGGKCINEINALAFEDASNNPEIEFKRKIRIAAGSFQNLFYFLPLLLKPGYLSFCFLSHKVLRWFGPVFILTFFTGSLFLHDAIFFRIIIGGTLLIAVSPLLDYLTRKMNVHLPFLRFFSHFATANAAQLAGLFRYLSGIKSSIWQPTARNQ